MGVARNATGEKIKKGLVIDNASLYDIAPTILHLSDLPVSKEMEGEVLTDCINNVFLEKQPVRFIDDYGAPVRHEEYTASGSEEEIKERLRALGYID